MPPTGSKRRWRSRRSVTSATWPILDQARFDFVDEPPPPELKPHVNGGRALIDALAANGGQRRANELLLRLNGFPARLKAGLDPTAVGAQAQLQEGERSTVEKLRVGCTLEVLAQGSTAPEEVRALLAALLELGLVEAVDIQAEAAAREQLAQAERDRAKAEQEARAQAESQAILNDLGRLRAASELALSAQESVETRRLAALELRRSWYAAANRADEGLVLEPTTWLEATQAFNQWVDVAVAEEASRISSVEARGALRRAARSASPRRLALTLDVDTVPDEVRYWVPDFRDEAEERALDEAARVEDFERSAREREAVRVQELELVARAKAEQERLEAEARAKAEQERLEAEARAKAEQERLEAEARAKAEQERLEAEARAKAEQERLEAEARAKAERERLEAEARAKSEQERLEAEARARAEQERLEAEARAKAEQERLEAEARAKSEQERLEAEARAKAERERLEAEARAKAEQERLEAEARAKAEQVRLEAEARAKAERERLEAEARAKAERERLEAEARAKAEQERLEAEARAKAEQERLEAEARANAEQERVEAEARAKAEQEREESRARARTIIEARAVVATKPTESKSLYELDREAMLVARDRAEDRRRERRAEAEARARIEEEKVLRAKRMLEDLVQSPPPSPRPVEPSPFDWSKVRQPSPFEPTAPLPLSAVSPFDVAPVAAAPSPFEPAALPLSTPSPFEPAAPIAPPAFRSSPPRLCRPRRSFRRASPRTCSGSRTPRPRTRSSVTLTNKRASGSRRSSRRSNIGRSSPNQRRREGLPRASGSSWSMASPPTWRRCSPALFSRGVPRPSRWRTIWSSSSPIRIGPPTRILRVPLG